MGILKFQEVAIVPGPPRLIESETIFSSYDKNCPFCSLLVRERNRVLYDRGSVMVVLNDPRQTPGHVLVVPKMHVRAIYELEQSARIELIEVMSRFQRNMIRILSEHWKTPVGCEIIFQAPPLFPPQRRKEDRSKDPSDHLRIHLRPWVSQEKPGSGEVSYHPLIDGERREFKELLAEQ